MSPPIDATRQRVQENALEDDQLCTSLPEQPESTNTTRFDSTVEAYSSAPSNSVSDFHSGAGAARSVASAFAAFDAALRDGYKNTNATRAAAAAEFVGASGDASTAGTVARSVSDLRNSLRELTQAQLTPSGKALSALLEKNRDWGAIVEKYGNPFDQAMSAEQRLAVAEKIIEGSAKSSAVANAVQALGKAMMVLNAAQAGWEIGRGVDKISRGQVGEGAVDAAEGGLNLALTTGTAAATNAGLLTGEAGVAAGGLTLAAGAAAAGAVALATETARAALKGEQTPVEIADHHYGTHFGDIYQWQKESMAARATLGVTTLGLSEAWFALNKSVGE